MTINLYKKLNAIHNKSWYHFHLDDFKEQLARIEPFWSPRRVGKDNFDSLIESMNK